MMANETQLREYNLDGTAMDLVDTLETAALDASAVAGRSVTTYEIYVLRGPESATPTASLCEEKLTDGSTVYNLYLRG